VPGNADLKISEIVSPRLPPCVSCPCIFAAIGTKQLVTSPRPVNCVVRRSGLRWSGANVYAQAHSGRDESRKNWMRRRGQEGVIDFPEASRSPKGCGSIDAQDGKWWMCPTAQTGLVGPWRTRFVDRWESWPSSRLAEHLLLRVRRANASRAALVVTCWPTAGILLRRLRRIEPRAQRVPIQGWVLGIRR